MEAHGGVGSDPIRMVQGLCQDLQFSGPVIEIPRERLRRWAIEGRVRMFHGGYRSGIELVAVRTEAGEPSLLKGWIHRLARSCPGRRFLHAQVLGDGRVRLGMRRPGQTASATACIRELTPGLLQDIQQVRIEQREHLVQRLADILGREELAGRFFSYLKAVLDRLQNGWTNLTPAEDSIPCRHDLSVTLICRLMFLAFLDRHRILRGTGNLLRWLLEQPRTGDIYRHLLRPLFFEVLNTPKPLRTARAMTLGDLPFLNGGLFQPLPVEVSHVQLTLPDPLLAETIHGLFERFEFMARKDSPAGSGAVIDPELLGHVFEALMNAEDRRRSGSFYTPSTLVRSLVQDSLVEVAARLGTEESRWIEGTLLGRGDTAPLSSISARRLDAHLESLRILDPAVGSGAFLLGMLDALVCLHLGLATLLGDPEDPGALRRRIITHNLYGVDLKSGAVRLCELRLWLSLITDGEPGSPLLPLPNLDHHIRQGDSLSQPFEEELAIFLPTGAPGEHLADERFAELHGPEKEAAVRARRDAEIGRLQQNLDRARTRVQAKLGELTDLCHQRDLFGSPRRLTAREQGFKRRLESERDNLESSQRGLDRQEIPFFSYPAAFPEVSRQGGFDLVLGNPPWIRLHEIPAAKRDYYRSRYRFMSGQGTGFEQQFDLSVAFVERALELTRPEGLVAFLLPAKVFRSRYGQAFRATISERHRVCRLVDFSLQRSRFFGAANYPAWLVVGKGAASPSDRTRLSLARPTGELVHQRIDTLDLGRSGLDTEIWSALPSSVLQAFETMRAGRSTLADHGVHARLGVKTGLNAVFLAERWRTLDGGEVELTMQDGTNLIVPQGMAPLVIRGRDLHPFKMDASARLLLPDHQLRDALPDRGPSETRIRAYFEKHLDALRQRRDHTAHKAPWAVFRKSGLSAGPKVLWRDIAPQLEAALVDGVEPVVPMNTTYFTPVPDVEVGHALTALLNCSWLRYHAIALAEPAMSGYLRFFAWTVERLPWPSRLELDSNEGRRLARLGADARSLASPDIQWEIDDLTAYLYALERPLRQVLEQMSAFYPQCHQDCRSDAHERL